MVPSARKAALRMGPTECIAGRFARGCSLSGISMGLVYELAPPRDASRWQDKVMAGGTPANPATMVASNDARAQSFLSQVDLVELLDAGGCAPASGERRRAAGLTRVRKAGLDLLADHLAHVNFQRGLQTAETPRLGGLVRWSGLRKREWVACARPGGVEGDAPDDSMVRMKAVRNIGIECEENVRPGSPDLAHELFAEVECFGKLRIRMAQKVDSLDSEHLRGELLLALANQRHLGA